MKTDFHMPKSHTPLQSRTSAFVRGGVITVIALGSLMLLFITAWMIPQYSEIYRDMLGARPLPSATLIVLHCRWLLVGLAFVWPLVGFILIQRRAPLGYLFLILALLLISFLCVMIPLFLPLVGTLISGIPPNQ